MKSLKSYFLFAYLVCASLTYDCKAEEETTEKPKASTDMRTPMAKAFDECAGKLLEGDVKDKFNECRRAPKSAWGKVNNRKQCMSMLPKDKAKPLMECVTENSAR